MTNFKTLQLELETSIKSVYEEGISMEDAEKLAAKFLYAQMAVSTVLKEADLDSRMRKSGLKAIKATIYLAEVQKADKKPSDVLLEHTINTAEEVNKEQDSFDAAEVTRDELERYFSIFKEGHIYFRGIAKGRME